MAVFRYEAADVSGKILRGAMDAPSEQEVARRLTERGYQAVQVQGAAVGATTIAAPTPVAAGGWSLGKAVSPADLGTFFRQMASLLNAGFTPASALGDLATRTAQKDLARAARQAADGTARGETISQNLGRFPALFLSLIHI